MNKFTLGLARGAHKALRSGRVGKIPCHVIPVIDGNGSTSIEKRDFARLLPHKIVERPSSVGIITSYNVAFLRNTDRHSVKNSKSAIAPSNKAAKAVPRTSAIITRHVSVVVDAHGGTLSVARVRNGEPCDVTMYVPNKARATKAVRSGKTRCITPRIYACGAGRIERR